MPLDFYMLENKDVSELEICIFCGQKLIYLTQMWKKASNQCKQIRVLTCIVMSFSFVQSCKCAQFSENWYVANSRNCIYVYVFFICPDTCTLCPLPFLFFPSQMQTVTICIDKCPLPVDGRDVDVRLEKLGERGRGGSMGWWRSWFWRGLASAVRRPPHSHLMRLSS